MRFNSSAGSESEQPGSEQPNAGRRKRVWILPSILAGSAILATVTVLSFAQNPAPQPHPLLLPAVNRPPDANLQMEMREQKSKRQNFDAANAERLRQLTQATEMLETMAIALKAEIDNTGSSQLSETAVHKAETIEKLAEIVKKRMELTVKPN